jgi:hypothetical protein
MAIEIVVFWVVTLCNLEDGYRHSEGTCGLNVCDRIVWLKGLPWLRRQVTKKLVTKTQGERVRKCSPFKSVGMMAEKKKRPF